MNTVNGSEHSHANFLNTVIAPTQVDPRVMDAFVEVDRAAFAPPEERHRAYTDEILDIKPGSTISQPSLVAQMMDLLELTGTEKVLEIGTASGYGAALLSRCAAEVHTVEYDGELASQAAATLAEQGFANVHVHAGDGLLGWPYATPYDAIMVTAGARHIPPTLENQLAEGGRIVIPVTYDGESSHSSVLVEGIKFRDKLELESVMVVDFVPLVSPHEGGWPANWKEIVGAAKLARIEDVSGSLGLSPAETVDLLKYIFIELMRAPDNIDLATILSQVRLGKKAYDALG